jgi:hypothetical protein
VAFFSEFPSFRISPISCEKMPAVTMAQQGDGFTGDTVRIAVAEESLFLDLIEP